MAQASAPGSALIRRGRRDPPLTSQGARGAPPVPPCAAAWARSDAKKCAPAP